MAQANAEPVQEEYDYEGLDDTYSVGQKLAAGAIAGIVEHTCMYPMDNVKTRMQVLHKTPSAVYNGVISSLARIQTVEGTRALWRGMSSVVIGAGPAHAVYFTTMEAVKEAMGANNTKEHQDLASVVSGAAACVTSEVIMTPFDVIKQRMQIHNSRALYKSAMDCVRHVYGAEGWKAFYVSYPTTIMVAVPFTSIQFFVYERFKKTMNPSGDYKPGIHAMGGFLAGGTAAAMTNPLDVVKTMLQTRGAGADTELRNVSKFVEGVKLVYKKEGFRGYAKGMQARALTAMPSMGVCWMSYEFCKSWFIQSNQV
ncbi:hypothetical protein HYFRA_00005443 [Hymenoscyphus fraxineus]|uniref:Mitochondrial carrier n=1 Tax=Hymenoscyphus fraxineus TaxID=746836 RepID=A0A9N9KS24_9HELO|nr:hypothetical protein HYFRA_00005443 [Hymenoscyphus fraxineus]